MENPESKLTELQFTILNGMADDYEDLEQLYLHANREFSEAEKENIQLLIQVRFPLRDLIDEIGSMLSEGYIKVKYANDDRGAPFDEQGVPDLAALHHYWFGATEKGTRAWKAHLAHEALEP